MVSLFAVQDEAAQQQLKKKRTFRKFTYRGVDLDQLLDMSYEQLMGLVGARARRRFSRGVCVCVCVCVDIHMY